MSEIVGWFKWFNLKNDPFSTSPITSANQEKLFYKTSDIQNKVDPIIRQLDVSNPFVKLLIGERGLGKTTTLYYIEKEAKNFEFIIPIPIEISFRNPNNVSPEIFIGEDILFQFIHKLLSFIHLNKNKVWAHNSDFFDKMMKNCRLEIYNDEIFPDPTEFPTFPTLRMTAHNILRLCESENYRVILLIDQIDKDPIEYALKFLKSSHSQTLLEMFTRLGGMIFITGKFDLYEKMFTGDRIDEEFSYLSDVIMLEPLKQTEAIELLNYRFKSEANQNFQNPLDIDVIHEITVSEKGVTRYIITKVKDALQKAYKLGEKKVTINLFNSNRFKRRDCSDIYYRLVGEDGTCKVASEKLTQLYSTLNNSSVHHRNALDLLRKIHKKQGLFKIEEFFIPLLTDQKLLLHNEMREQIVAPEISIFFNKLEEKHITLTDFIGWFSDSKLEEISLSEEKVEPDRILNIFDVLLKEIKNADFNTVSNIKQDGSKEEIIADSLRQIIRQRIQTSQRNYLELRNIDWEETAKPEVYRRINETLFRFLEAFTFFSASYFQEELSFKARRGMWGNIYFFALEKAQPHFGIYLDTFDDLKQLRIISKIILVDKSTEPSSQELVNSYNDVEKIILEFFNKILSPMLNIQEKQKPLKFENYIENGKKILKQESIGVGQKLKAEQIIKEFLENIEGDVFCWLNYIDETTLSYLNNLPRACKIKLITSEIQNQNEFMKRASKLGKVNPKLEVKMVRVNSSSSDESQEFSERDRAIIHKRRLCSNNVIIDFGTDLKSSALGNTKHDIVLMEVDSIIKDEFDKEWNRDESEWTRIEGIPIKITCYSWP